MSSGLPTTTDSDLRDHRDKSSRWSFSTCKKFLADMAVNLIGMCVLFVLVIISVSQYPS